MGHLVDIVTIQKSKMASKILLVLVILAVMAPVTQALFCPFIDIWDSIFGCSSEVETPGIFCQISDILRALTGCRATDPDLSFSCHLSTCHIRRVWGLACRPCGVWW